MKLLIFTQVMDKDDAVLSVYHNWLLTIASRYESAIVICLKKGRVDLPENVKVFSLGKELGLSRIGYVQNFFSLIVSLRREYDSVFVHMNQEYVLLGGWLWKLWDKKMYMWRNHHAGSLLTDIAAAFCAKVFCTSKFSYTAKYPKTVIMPIGVNIDAFKPFGRARKPRSLLFLARIAPVKKPHVLVAALGELAKKGIDFSASIYGDSLPENAAYHESLKESVKENGIEGRVSFFPGVPNDRAPELYNDHEIFVNLSSSGMYDKTIFEAMACETLVLSTNKNLEGVIDPRFNVREDDASDTASKLEVLLAMDSAEKTNKGKDLRKLAEGHSIETLADRLEAEIQSI